MSKKKYKKPPKKTAWGKIDPIAQIWMIYGEEYIEILASEEIYEETKAFEARKASLQDRV